MSAREQLPKLATILEDIEKIEKKLDENQLDLLGHLQKYLDREVSSASDEAWRARLQRLHEKEMHLERVYADARQTLVIEKQNLRKEISSPKLKLRKAIVLAQNVTQLLEDSCASLDAIR